MNIPLKLGGGTDLSYITAGAPQILTDYIGANQDGDPVNGSMPNNGAVTPTITSQNGTYTIPAGYHNGSGVVTANVPTRGPYTIAATDEFGKDSTNVFARFPANVYYNQAGSKTGYCYLYIPGTYIGTAAASSVLKDQTFSSSAGAGIKGTMTNNGAWSSSGLAAGSSVTIPAGYHNGSGKVTAAGIPSSYHQCWINTVNISGPTTYNTSSGSYSMYTVNFNPGFTPNYIFARAVGEQLVTSVYIRNRDSGNAVTYQGNSYVVIWGGQFSVTSSSVVLPVCHTNTWSTYAVYCVA